MGQLILFSFYVLGLSAVIWNLMRLIGEPQTRTVGRVLFVVLGGALLTIMIGIGVFD